MQMAANFFSSNRFAERKMLNRIEIGTKLSKADAPSYVLEVLAILTRKHELPHARARVCTGRVRVCGFQPLIA